MHLHAVIEQFPCYHIWLSLSGYHARYRWEPKGSPPLYSAATLEGLVDLIEEGAPPLPKRIPSPPERAAQWEPADADTLARVLAALRRRAG